jgi:hypothetical protein
MLNNREISEIFEVQLNTLYNWQKTKPKLLKYLQNADYNSSRNKEINILLDEYSTTFNKNFSVNELEYMINSSFELVCIEDIQNFGHIFMKTEYKNIPLNNTIILSIYDKIKIMNIIEKYILYKKIYKYRENSIIKLEDLKIYFQEFLQ